MTDIEFLPLPAMGRGFRGQRTVRLGDTWMDGSLRLDAAARYLQDIATDDAADAGLEALVWVVRRAAFLVEGRPRLDERVELTTFCTGLGPRWAERRTSLVGPRSRIESSALWVHVDPLSGRPVALPPRLGEVYADTAMGRKVQARLKLPLPPPRPDDSLRFEPWPLRPTDFDVLGHVNNAVYWTFLDEPSLRHGRVVLEFRSPIEPETKVDVLSTGDGASRWLVSDAEVHASGTVERT